MSAPTMSALGSQAPPAALLVVPWFHDRVEWPWTTTLRVLPCQPLACYSLNSTHLACPPCRDGPPQAQFNSSCLGWLGQEITVAAGLVLGPPQTPLLPRSHKLTTPSRRRPDTSVAMADHTVDADEEEPPLLLDRAARATRGKRITKLLEEDVEEDEVFWNQDALKEDENDDIYEEEQDAGDEFDSDFGEDESEPDDEPEKEVRESLPIKKRLIFPGKTLKKMKPKKKKVISKLEDEGKTDKSSDKPSPSKQADIPDELETEKTIRKSTRTSVIVRQAEREAIRAEKEATVKPTKKKKEGEEKRMTQEEMLLEAAETEIMNLRNLERVLAREEEVKKKAVVHKAVYEGPTIRFCSRDGESHLEFINGASFGSELCTNSAPYPEKSVCVVTGLPAKYRDPKTGLPYATMESFKIIRESFLKEEADKRRPNMSNMGELFESITSEHSTPKKRRIEARSPNVSAGLRHGGRFRRIPALDMLDED